MSKAEKFISDCTRNCSNELVAVESRAGIAASMTAAARSVSSTKAGLTSVMKSRAAR